jgi:phosphonate transport system substrate-binding protein
VLQAMLGLADEPRGREALKAIGFNGLEAGRDADWDDVRALGIQTLASLLRD